MHLPAGLQPQASGVMFPTPVSCSQSSDVTVTYMCRPGTEHKREDLDKETNGDPAQNRKTAEVGGACGERAAEQSHQCHHGATAIAVYLLLLIGKRPVQNDLHLHPFKLRGIGGRAVLQRDLILSVAG